MSVPFQTFRDVYPAEPWMSFAKAARLFEQLPDDARRQRIEHAAAYARALAGAPGGRVMNISRFLAEGWAAADQPGPDVDRPAPPGTGSDRSPAPPPEQCPDRPGSPDGHGDPT